MERCSPSHYCLEDKLFVNAIGKCTIFNEFCCNPSTHLHNYLHSSKQLTSRKPVIAAITSHWDSQCWGSLQRAYFNLKHAFLQPNRTTNLIYDGPSAANFKVSSERVLVLYLHISLEDPKWKLRQRSLLCSLPYKKRVKSTCTSELIKCGGGKVSRRSKFDWGEIAYWKSLYSFSVA